MRQLTPTEQAWPWVRFPVLSPEMQAARDKLIYPAPAPGAYGANAVREVRNHKGLLASIEEALDAGIPLPPIRLWWDPADPDRVLQMGDGNHRLYVARLRGAAGLYAHLARRDAAGPLVWVDLRELDHIDVEQAFGEPFKPEWEWRDDPRRAAIGLEVLAMPNAVAREGYAG